MKETRQLATMPQPGLLLQKKFEMGRLKIRIMKAEEFYRLNKYGKRMENDYFIAMDKQSLFRLMDAYAKMKCDENTNIELGLTENNMTLSEVL